MSYPTEHPDPYAQPSGGFVPGSTEAFPPLPDETFPPAAPERSGLGAVALRVLLAVALGAAVALLGAATHRTLWNGLPLGLVIALALTLSTAVLCRAWAGMTTLAAAGLGWLVLAQFVSLPGRGGDVIITDPSVAIPWAWAGVAWSYAGIAIFGVVAFLPRRWFARR